MAFGGCRGAFDCAKQASGFALTFTPMHGKNNSSYLLQTIVLVLWISWFCTNSLLGATHHYEFVSGNVRIQFLSNSLLRVEEKSPNGFEDRPTFQVVGRDWPGVSFGVREEAGNLVLTNAAFLVTLPRQAESLSQVTVRSVNGDLLYAGREGLPALRSLPAPSVQNPVWLMADTPRIIPPALGAVPPPGNEQDPNSGWDLGSDAKDVYVFAPGQGGYAQLRRDFLHLTGPVPLPPLFTFGYWHSRYYKYTDKTALELIDTYQQKQIPIDLFVLDTDWRVGGSAGYEVATNLFPDLRQFIAEAHAREVRVMLNDHPSPVDTNGVSPQELKYRRNGLASLYELGADVWWYDRNWRTHLKPPVDEISIDAWGMRLYHDIVQTERPGKRPLIMANVEGIRNGYLSQVATPSTHRYPIWWTGDTTAEWQYLRLGVWNAVDLGVESLLPYVNEDLTGHRGMPSPELYVRFMQYGAFSPVMRLHCDKEVTREPWAFGAEAEAIVSDYIRLRYRLLPYLYSAAARAAADGTPILRRCDLEWPEFPEAADHSQFLFGDDLLVAPAMSGADDFESVPEENFCNEDGKPGVTIKFFANPDWRGEIVARQDSAIANYKIGWFLDPFPSQLNPTNYSARFSGELVDIPETGVYRLGLSVSGDEMLRFTVADQKFSMQPTGEKLVRWIEVPLNKGERYPYLIESSFSKGSGRSPLHRLLWRTPTMKANEGRRSLWIPPGQWEDVWTGETITGPAKRSVTPSLGQMPIWMRCGGIVFSIPQVQSTQKADYSTVIVDAFVSPNEQKVSRSLYEDDGCSINYLRGEFSQTAVTLETKNQQATFSIQPPSHQFTGQSPSRNWVIRLHLPSSTALAKCKIHDADKSEIKSKVIELKPEAITMPFLGAGASPAHDAGSVWEFSVPSWPVSKSLVISGELVRPPK
jgi:alpha-glucosidase (family GH31 glycosyl hydrolase)